MPDESVRKRQWPRHPHRYCNACQSAAFDLAFITPASRRLTKFGQVLPYRDCLHRGYTVFSGQPGNVPFACPHFGYPPKKICQSRPNCPFKTPRPTKIRAIHRTMSSTASSIHTLPSHRVIPSIRHTRPFPAWGRQELQKALGCLPTLGPLLGSSPDPTTSPGKGLNVLSLDSL